MEDKRKVVIDDLPQIDDIYRAYLSKEVLRVKKIKEDAETAMREALNSLRAWGIGLV